ncbi:MAG: HEAT repeat domain-containing protein, partial [Nannocystaceae bacterium]
AILLGDLIAVIAPEELTTFITFVGKGHPTLRLALRQALVRRVREAPAERDRVLPAIDGALASADPSQQAALLGLRSAVQDGPDPAFRARLIALVDDASAAFVVRVAALRLLAADLGSADSAAAIGRLAAASLAVDARNAQAAEILGHEALRALPDATARELIARHELQRATAPRLAAAAFERGELTGTWLADGLAHAWPEVQVAALTRVQAPCDADAVAAIERVAAPRKRQPDAEPVVVRAALRGLGRCASPQAEKVLIRVLEDEARDPIRRSEAARQLLSIGSPKGLDAVAEALRGAADPALARRFVEVIRGWGRSTPELRGGLCLLADYHQELRSTIAEALRQIDEAPCAEDEAE